MSDLKVQILYTPDQQKLLDENERFIPAAILDDGELLVLEDAGPLGGPYEGSRIAKYLPWILTRHGKIQGISHHYEQYHDLTAPLGESHFLEPGPDLERPERKLITLEDAADYLASAYGIRISTRSLRTWCTSGKIACRRFSQKANAPWYTTTGALDQIAAKRTDVKQAIP